MKAYDVMTRDVVTVGPGTPVATAAALMVEQRVSGLPVLDAEGKVVGMFTESDLLHRVETGTEDRHRSRFLEFLLGSGRSAQDYVTSRTRRVEDLMTRDLAAVDVDADLEDVVTLMEKRRVRRVAVLRDGKLAGVVSRLDLVRAVARKVAEAQAAESDLDMQDRLVKELDRQPWIAAANLAVAVEDGVVTLRGVIYDERCRRALHVACENLAEGIRVKDELTWADPGTAMVIAGA